MQVRELFKKKQHLRQLHRLKNTSSDLTAMLQDESLVENDLGLRQYDQILAAPKNKLIRRVSAV